MKGVLGHCFKHWAYTMADCRTYCDTNLVCIFDKSYKNYGL